MILKLSNDKINTKTKIIFICDKCDIESNRPYGSYLRLREENKYFDKDYCQSCWGSIRQKTSEHKLKMSESIKSMMSKDPTWSIRNSESKKGKINLGDSNGMKSNEARNKASVSRKKIMTYEFKHSISLATKKAWSDGKFEGVAVGRCKWYDYKHSDGTVYKVQGTWELEFIKWLDDNNMQFLCHRGRLSYTLEGKNKNYYPDFFVKDWNCYVDIKNKYHYSISLDKFESLLNEGHNIKIILKEELETLINKKL